MSTDYQGNSKKSKETKETEEKTIEKVVVGEVVTRKRPLGRKFKDVFINADFKGVLRYICADVLLPAARNMIVDASTKGIERMMYGEDVARRRSMGGPRYSYQTPVSRGFRESRTRPPSTPAHRPVRAGREDFILSSRDEAELVVERMNDIIDSYEYVSVADLNELVGFPFSHTDNKWGWYSLHGVRIQQIREGFVIDFPPAEPLI